MYQVKIFSAPSVPKLKFKEELMILKYQLHFNSKIEVYLLPHVGILYGYSKIVYRLL